MSENDIINNLADLRGKLQSLEQKSDRRFDAVGRELSGMQESYQKHNISIRRLDLAVTAFKELAEVVKKQGELLEEYREAKLSQVPIEEKKHWFKFW